ncbi:MAG: Asp-tRNA(Asn)/Glu-tRNA(Gln) amidotransferase subunit GatC [Oscillospiraceae bacterium]|nr:Asp-tRNA(Asn)/Glu-tRNA(Gln) amidotransferase subunit GatC [Oscillospiraceae bacterium]MBQ8978229.1 Asp-tRNA(Asn)/Glu-tRNA(Gln) amidotransferase subunit GatC [Oscillospiraceae bacterium]MBR4224358.1 Asp-tRNA(Asn)/Glu-tRNA(Gln) amidotransferase subunit GatC [Oscillospiraceae bacterium]
MELEMVKYLSKLAKLSYTDEELEQAVKDMTSIIEIMDTIKDIDVTYDPYKDNHNVYLEDLREDVAQPSLPTDKLLQNAVNQDNCFVVPKVVE